MIDIECTVTAVSHKQASRVFELASRRLLNVNRWSTLNNSLLPTSQLLDGFGNVVQREVHANDYFIIGSGREDAETPWLKVESVEKKQHTQDETQIVCLQARATSHPRANHDGERAGTGRGIIRVVRKGLNITASVHAECFGEPENHVVHRMKNISRTAYSTLGAYCIQWRSFVNGILGDMQHVDEHLAI